MTQSRYPLRRTTLACAMIIAVILGIITFRACRHEDASDDSFGHATEAQMARLDSIEMAMTELEKRAGKLKGKKKVAKDSTATSGKRSKKEKTPRKKPVERSFLDEDVNR